MFAASARARGSGGPRGCRPPLAAFLAAASFHSKIPQLCFGLPILVTSVISGIPGRIKVPVVRVYCGSEIPTVPNRSRYRGTTVGIHSSVGISSHLVARYEDTFLYLLSSSAPIVRAQDKGARLLPPPTLPWLFGSGARGQGALARGFKLASVVATASFPLINPPTFILASLS